MKTKSLSLGILLIIAFAIISVFIYNFDKDVYKFLSIIILGVIGVLLLFYTQV